MKKFFVAFRFSGEKEEVLQERLSTVVQALTKAGIDAYCNFFDQHEIDKQFLTTEQIMKKAFKQIDEMDGLFVIIAGNEKSEGQLIEVGYALAKGKEVIAAVHSNAKTYVDKLASQSVRWKDLNDLRESLEGLKV